jgi:glucose-1-phosphate thymidylyltransferase
MKTRKGIVLAGGTGSRLHPVTKGISKQLLPVYDKPMIYYPLSVLLLSGIREILIITTPHEQEMFVRLLGDGSQFGVKFTYAEQPTPGGLAQAFIIGEEFIGGDHVTLVLGDNIFYGHGLPAQLKRASECRDGATVFGYYVKDPERYGVLEFAPQSYDIVDIVEKPVKAPSHWAVTGLYYYDNSVIEIAHSIKPSPRGELEITDVNRVYLQRKQLFLERIGRGFAWLDTGTQESLLHAGTFIQTIQERQGLQVACLEEIAYRRNFISKEDVERIALTMKNSSYGQYLLQIISENSL